MTEGKNLNSIYLYTFIRSFVVCVLALFAVNFVSKFVIVQYIFPLLSPELNFSLEKDGAYEFWIAVSTSLQYLKGAVIAGCISAFTSWRLSRELLIRNSIVVVSIWLALSLSEWLSGSKSLLMSNTLLLFASTCFVIALSRVPTLHRK